MTVLGDASAQVANTSYLWIWVIIGVFTVIGFGFGAFKWIRQTGIDAAKLENRLASIEKQLKPNGLDTEQVGDVVKRTENAVNELTAKLNQHIGAEAEAREQMQRQIDRKQDKESKR